MSGQEGLPVRARNSQMQELQGSSPRPGQCVPGEEGGPPVSQGVEGTLPQKEAAAAAGRDAVGRPGVGGWGRGGAGGVRDWVADGGVGWLMFLLCPLFAVCFSGAFSFVWRIGGKEIGGPTMIGYTGRGQD